VLNAIDTAVEKFNEQNNTHIIVDRSTLQWNANNPMEGRAALKAVTTIPSYINFNGYLLDDVKPLCAVVDTDYNTARSNPWNIKIRLKEKPTPIIGKTPRYPVYLRSVLQIVAMTLLLGAAYLIGSSFLKRPLF
jgi:hypothetical protein